MKVVSTEKAPKALGPYSQGYVHGGILYSAGQIGINPATDTVEADTIEGQAEQACKNIGEILSQKLRSSKDAAKEPAVRDRGYCGSRRIE